MYGDAVVRCFNISDAVLWSRRSFDIEHKIHMN